MQICVFEDSSCLNLYPLTLTRPVSLLRCGVATLFDKIIRHCSQKDRIVLLCRSELQKTISLENVSINDLRAEETIFINGRLLAEASFVREFLNVKKAKKEIVLVQENTVLMAKVKNGCLEQLKKSFDVTPALFKTLKRLAPIHELVLVNSFWQLINLNGDEIVRDSKYFSKGRYLKLRYSGVSFKGRAFYLGKRVNLGCGVIIDSRKGAVIIDDEADVMPNSVLIGPLYIGKKTVIKAGARIYQNTTIGPACKVGGEVEDTIFLGYSNKQHEGFMGHAYIGEWVNLGAGTENSDLRNNYSAVEVSLNGVKKNTGLLFVGCCIGDHTKTGIKTMINTGSVFGCFGNLFGAGYQPKEVPSFIWHNNGAEKKEYILKKALEVAALAMARRGQVLEPAQKELYTQIYKKSSTSRKAFLKSK